MHLERGRGHSVQLSPLALPRAHEQIRQKVSISGILAKNSTIVSAAC